MSNRGLPPQRFYTSVHVLLLHWDTRSDDLQTKCEGSQNTRDEFYAQLIKLRDTLLPANKYNYNVEVYGLTAQAPYRGLNVKLLDFLEKDDDGVLLIIYYGGHAKIDTDRNLIWLRHDPARQADARNPKLKWSSLQQLLLSGCKSQVLLLLDCCNAAASIEDASSASVVEVTTSTGFENLAPLQSTNSFTAHLVLTLEDLLARRAAVPASVLCKKVTARLKARWLGRDANERRVTPHHFALNDDVECKKVVIARHDPSDELAVSTDGPGIGFSLDMVVDVEQTEQKTQTVNEGEQALRHSSFTKTLPLSLKSEEKPGPANESHSAPEIVFHAAPLRPSAIDRLPLQPGTELRADAASASLSQFQPRPVSPVSSVYSQDSWSSPGRQSLKRSRKGLERPGLISASDPTAVKAGLVHKQNTYRYTPLKQNNEIRLLHILQGKAQEMVRCAFSVERFVESDEIIQDFHALSYVWGSSYCDHEIQIVENMHEFSVTGVFHSFYVRPGLHAALCRLRSEHKQVILWVDAICINQEDFKEKNHQVDLISWIFHEACHVCVWLGDDADGSDELQDFLLRILDLTQVDKLIKADSKASQWKAFADFMLRPWFSRRWIIQEAIRAQTATLYCGSNFALGWLDFCDAVGVFASRFDEIRELFRMSPQFNYNPDALVDIRGLAAYTLVSTTQNLFRHSFDGGISSYRADLETLVSYLPALESYDPRDAIYALLALSSDGLTSPPIADSDSLADTVSIVVDYKKSPFEVFRQFVDFCVRKSKSLDILCRHWAPESIELPRAMVQTGSEVFPGGGFFRPSWIPSISGLPFGKRGRHRYGRNNGDSLVGTPDKKWYNAAKGTIGMAIFGQLEPDISTQTDAWHLVAEVFDRSMIVSGFQLDTIVALSPRAPGGSILSDWIEMAGWTEGDATVPDFFWRSLVADRAPYGTPPPTWYHRACLYCLEQSGGYDVEMSRFTGDYCPSIVIEFLDRVRNVIWNRKFFRTSIEEGEGLYGLAPGKSQVGDVVCILNGCSVPVVLRKRHDFEGSWELIGESFVYGMMDGEAMTDDRFGKTQEFELR